MLTGRIEVIDLYGDLALEAAQDDDRTAAEHWLARGRQAESPQKRSAHALAWEMIGLEVKMLLDDPDVWVPVLAVILERCRGNQEATSAVLLRLVSLGLVQAGVDPKRPDQLLLDTQILEQYLKRYGPRVTTATGELGVAASQGEIWTPESTERSLDDLDTGLRCRAWPSEKSRSSSCPARVTARMAESIRSPLRPNRYFDFIRRNFRPDTARRRKIIVERRTAQHDGATTVTRRDSWWTASLDTQTNSGL